MTFKPGDRVRILKDRFPPIKGPSRIGMTGVVRTVRGHSWGWLNVDVAIKCCEVESHNGNYWFDEAELSRVVAWP